ncbi:phosphoketolase [Bosea sp. OAE506]
MTLQSRRQHPHGLSDADFEALFTADKPVIFAFHGYPQLIHRLTYDRPNHAGLHVHGYREEGTTTTPFDMLVMNGLDRFHLAIAAIERLTKPGPEAERARRRFEDRLIAHAAHIREHGEDMPEIRDWRWGSETVAR